ncbi:hypothetical protein [Lutibacter sp.]|uniref:hypothetical protein n=1 Tax=Lutibacter sp. TaxID=1925666 RepID=UPI002735721D|nr:hypothetical protein [Lutibacter sp.]MDP3312134.1 hypothetical protein [Lutibacter sp.]
MAKFVPIFLLTILFITTKSCWASSILVPISVYLFQLISIVNDSTLYFDEIEFIYTLPLIIQVLIILYLIRIKLSIYLEAVDLKKEMEEKMSKSQNIKY